MRRVHLKKIALLSIGLFLAVAASLAIFCITNPHIDFTYFEPSYLPPNTTINAKRIVVTHSRIFVEQNFRTEDWVYAIDQYKAEEPVGSAEQNFDAESIKPTCDLRITPEGVGYRVCHWIDYGRINVYEVRFIKEGTFVNAKIPTTLDQHVSMEQIDTFVDSFVHKDTFGFPVLRTNGA